MRLFKLLALVCAAAPMAAYADVSELEIAIVRAREQCAGMSEKLDNVKKMAGLSTAVSAVGTAAGAGATATGVLKMQQDDGIESINDQIAALEQSIQTAEEAARQHDMMHADENAAKQAIAKVYAALKGISVPAVGTTANRDEINANREKLSELQSRRDAILKKSKTFGDVRTGLAAGAAATNVAGAIISGTNRVDRGLDSHIAACKKSVDELKRAHQMAAIDRSASDTELATAQRIIDGCYALETVNLDAINRRGTGAMGANIVGAATGVAAAATSGVAGNHIGETDNKTKNLNMASTVLSGATGAASLTAVVFNATQIGAIKRAAEIIDTCQGALK